MTVITRPNTRITPIHNALNQKKKFHRYIYNFLGKKIKYTLMIFVQIFIIRPSVKITKYKVCVLPNTR